MRYTELKVFDKEDLFSFFKFILPKCDDKQFLKIYYEWVDDYRVTYQEDFTESVKFEKIFIATCIEFGVTKEDVLNNGKKHKFTLVKKCVGYICHTIYKMPPYVMMEKLGYVKGSRIYIYNCKKFETDLQNDNGLKNKVNSILNKLK